MHQNGDDSRTELVVFVACVGKECLIGTVLYKTISLDGSKVNTNPKTNPNPNTNRIQLFYAFFEHHPLIFNPAHSFTV